jgi:hypothetical protein
MSTPIPSPATLEITTFLDSQLSSFRTFLQSRDELTEAPDELNKEIALHNTRMLKVVSDFNNSMLPGQNLTPLLPIPSGRGEWDDFTGGEEMRTKQLFAGNETGEGRYLFASHHPGIFNKRKTKAKGYVRAGASTLFGSGGSGAGRGFERRLFEYEFDDDSSMGSVDEEETPSKRRRSGNGKREKQIGGNGKWKGKGKMNGEVVVLDSSEGESEANRTEEDNGIIEGDPDIKKEARRASSGILGRGGEDDAVVANEGNSAHQKRMNWTLEMTERKRKGEGGDRETDMSGKKGRPRKNMEMEIGGVDTAEIKRGRGRPRKVGVKSFVFGAG